MALKLNTNVKWKFMGKVSIQILYAAVMLNQNEALCYGLSDSQKIGWIYKWKINSNEWTEIVQSPKNMRYYIMDIDKDNNKLYMFGYDGMVTIDLESKQVNTKTAENKGYIYTRNCSITYANNSIHSIGGWKGPKHILWNDKTEVQGKTVHDFKQYSRMYSCGLIHVTSKQILLLLGGHGSHNTYIKDIHRYSLVTNTWATIPNVSFKMSLPALALTSDQRYVIIAGGYNEHCQSSDKIYLFDMKDNNFEINQSIQRLPKPGYCRILLSGGIKDDMLVFGWCRKLFNTHHFIDLQKPPSYIIKLISNSYSIEELHYIDMDCLVMDHNKHFVISMKHILKTV